MLVFAAFSRACDHRVEIQPGAEVGDGLDQGPQEMKALFLVDRGKLDEPPFLQRVQKALHQSTPNFRKNQLFTKCVRTQYAARNPAIHSQ